MRFAFWGAEEQGLMGSNEYIKTLDVEALKDIALYLNFDMLGSPNPGYFTYDGDQSAPPSQRRRPARAGGFGGNRAHAGGVPQGRGQAGRGHRLRRPVRLRRLHQAGIPAGGLFSGAEENKTAEQAKLWGGDADKPFDPNYHKPTDTIDHIDRTSLDIHGRGVAYAIGLYAQDQSGRNGVPVRDDRTRHTVPES